MRIKEWKWQINAFRTRGKDWLLFSLYEPVLWGLCEVVLGEDVF